MHVIWIEKLTCTLYISQKVLDGGMAFFTFPGLYICQNIPRVDVSMAQGKHGKGKIGNS